MPDISATLVSNSDQLDNVDLMGGARVFTITDVEITGGEQPLTIRLAEYPRPWKPGLTVRRILNGIWGSESDEWIGRRVRLFRDETVTFGKAKTGGTRISHATDITKAVTLTLPTSKGKFGEFTVQPLKDDPKPTPTPEPTAEQVAASTSEAELKAMWESAGPERREQILARVEELRTTPDALPIGDDQ